MQTTKKKVDVAAIVANAKSKVSDVKTSTEAIASKTNNFRLIPGFGKYEFNGNIIRNVKTKNPLSIEKGRSKYRLEGEDGSKKSFSKEEISGLFPKETKQSAPKAEKKVKELKAKKEKGEKREIKNHHVPNPLPIEKLKEDAREIMTFPDKSFNKVMKLFKAGYNKEEIIEITGKRNDVISKYLRPYLKGKK